MVRYEQYVSIDPIVLLYGTQTNRKKELSIYLHCRKIVSNFLAEKNTSYSLEHKRQMTFGWMLVLTMASIVDKLVCLQTRQC